MERDHQTTLPVVLITWCLSVGSINRALVAESQVIGKPHPIVAVAGDDVILPCSLEPPFDAEDMTVEWSRSGMDPEYVHVYRDGRNLVRDQNPSYNYRTSMFEEELFKGNVSLKLFGVKLEDEGYYSCRIISYRLFEREDIQLIVVAVSEPKISIMGATGVVLQCESEGWYPEPQLEWREGPKDSEGRLLSADVTQIHREPDGRYTVRSSMTVQKTDTNMFTCRVQLMKLNLKREAEIHVLERSCYWPGVDTTTAICVVVVAAALALVISASLLYCLCQKKSQQPAGRKKREERHQTLETRYQSASEETRAEIEKILLRGLDPDTRRTNGGSREGEDRGWSSRAESNANSGWASPVLEDSNV